MARLPTGNVPQIESLSKVIANIYTEVFARKPANPNTPINRTQHLRKDLVFRDDTKIREITIGSITFVWGPGGKSDETSGTPQSVRWGFTGQWA